MANSKRKVFTIIVVLFLIFAPITLLYSWGYRFDFKNNKITQTGGFYFKIKPKGVKILLDDKQIKKTDLFFGAAYIDNVLPGTYKIEVQKEGYHSWQKNLEVKEKFVTEAKNIILIPKDPIFTVITNNVNDFTVSFDQRKIILKENENEKNSLKILDIQSNLKTHLANEEELKDASTTPYLTELINLDFVSDATNETAIATTSYKFVNNVEKNGLYQFNKKEKSLYVNIVSSYRSPYKITEEVNDVKLSPNEKRLAYFSDHEVWIIFLKEEFEQQKRSAGEKLLIGRFSDKINDISWLGDNYIIFIVGNKLKIAELDNRDKLNIVDFAEFKDAKIFFSNKFNTLYVLSEKKLFYLKDFLP